MVTAAETKAALKNGVEAPDGPVEAPEAGNVDKIRDILFGAQMQDYERRFGAVEVRLTKEAADLRDEIRGRLDNLESFVKKELDALTTRLKTERRDRTEAVKDLTGELKDTAKQLDKRVIDLDEQTGNELRDLRERLLQQSKALTDDLARAQAGLTRSLSDEVGTLRAEKTDRAALAALLAEVAMRLSDEPEQG